MHRMPQSTTFNGKKPANQKPARLVFKQLIDKQCAGTRPATGAWRQARSAIESSHRPLVTRTCHSQHTSLVNTMISRVIHSGKRALGAHACGSVPAWAICARRKLSRFRVTNTAISKKCPAWKRNVANDIRSTASLAKHLTAASSPLSEDAFLQSCMLSREEKAAPYSRQAHVKAALAAKIPKKIHLANLLPAKPHPDHLMREALSRKHAICLPPTHATLSR
jgi:hypothetical protein